MSPNGISCNYPILVGQTPSYCNGHIDLIGNKESKPPTRKRKAPGEGEDKVELKKKVKEEKTPALPKEAKKVNKKILPAGKSRIFLYPFSMNRKSYYEFNFIPTSLFSKSAIFCLFTTLIAWQCTRKCTNAAIFECQDVRRSQKSNYGW